MSTLKNVEKTIILKKVISIVKLAKKEILATMDLAEELKQPLSSGYFLLLHKKMQDGVVVKRLAFGIEADFKAFNKKHPVKHKNYKCVLTASKNYKRMLLIDQKYLFFAVDIEGKRDFFYTTNSALIKKFSCYFFANFSGRNSLAHRKV